MSNPGAELEVLNSVKWAYGRKGDPTSTCDWKHATVMFPDLERAWEQVHLAQLAFGALLQEKIDER